MKKWPRFSLSGFLKRKASQETKEPSTHTEGPVAFVEGQFEVCVLCRNATDVPADMPIQNRHGYVEGHGQMCKNCYRAFFG